MALRLINNLKSIRLINSSLLFNTSFKVQKNEFHRTLIDLADPIRLKMPALSPTMTEGQIIKWHKKEGDKVSPGDVLFDVQTDKAVMSFELEEEGVIAKIFAPEGNQTIQVGSLVGLLVMPGDDWKNVSVTPDVSAPTPKTQEASASQPAHDHHNHAPDGIKIMPAARIILNNYNIDPKTLPNTKSHGFISKSDVREFIIQNNLSPAPVKQVESQQLSIQTVETPKKSKVVPVNEEHEPDFEDIELSNMRKIIAKRLVLSKTTIPHSYMSSNCVVDKIVELRKEMIKDNKKVSLNDFIIKALALSLKLIPELNSNQNATTGEFNQLSSVDISVAVATDKGLITPIVKNADRLSVLGISESVKNLADKARQGKLLPHEFQGGSFSISNLGMFGISEFSAVINPPQIGILAVGASKLKFDADMNVQTVVTFNLSYDERCCDLERATKFMNTLNYLIANPQLLVDHSYPL